MQVAAIIELFVCWFAWAYPFILQTPRRQRRTSVADPRSTVIGVILQGSAVFIAWATHFSLEDSISPARVIASMAMGPLAAALAWQSAKHLGRLYRVATDAPSKAELAVGGPYRFIRHPVYASLLLLLLSTLLLLAPWMWFAASVALYIAGTEIRSRAEDRLLAAHFGEEFEKYRKQSWAYFPFIR